MSKYNKKSNIKDELSINTDLYYKKIEDNSLFSTNENFHFEIRYFLFCVCILFSSFINLHKNNIYQYNFKLLILLIIYFSRRSFSKVWFHYRLSQFFSNPTYSLVLIILTLIIMLDLIYLLVSLYINNSLFHISALLMVATLQLPSVKIFPDKDNRYDGAPQEIIYNIKSKYMIIII